MPAVYDRPDPKAASTVGRKARKPAAAKPITPAPANSNVAAPSSGWQRVEVVESQVEARPKGSALVMRLRTEAGDTLSETITLEDASQDVQDAGQRQFRHLRLAAGSGVIDKPEELLGLVFEHRVVNGKPEYQAIAVEAA
jgi:hypothetical protein